MTTEFKLPELGEGVDRADVARIFVEVGDQIEADQNVMELETEKAVADLPCPHAGEVTEILVSVGDTVEIGQALLKLEAVEAEADETEAPSRTGTTDKQEAEEVPSEEEEEAGAREKQQAKQKQEKSEKRGTGAEDTGAGDTGAEDTGAEDTGAEKQKEPAQAEKKQPRDESADEAEPPGDEGDGRAAVKSPSPLSTHGGDELPPPAGPATRRLARKLQVDLAELQPSDGGRIRQEDVVRAYVESGKATGLRQQELPDFERFGTTERLPLNHIASTSAERLAASWRTIPHVTQHGLADVTQLETARRAFVSEMAPSDPKLTLTALTVKALVGALKRFPKFNSSFDGDRGELVLKHYYNIGVAVDTDHGLLVPIIRSADRMTLLEIAREIEHLSARARDHNLQQEDMQGGTCTISNQGGIGGGHFTPIINWPEVAILGLGRTEPQLVMRNGKPEQRLKLPLSLSYDHRAINGAEAARFIDALQEILSGTFELLLAS